MALNQNGRKFSRRTSSLLGGLVGLALGAAITYVFFEPVTIFDFPMDVNEDGILDVYTEIYRGTRLFRRGEFYLMLSNREGSSEIKKVEENSDLYKKIQRARNVGNISHRYPVRQL